MIGQPLDRVDGPLKVTGRATYPYETRDAGQPLYGVIVSSTIGRGRIQRIDVSLARSAAGVRTVLTHVDAPPQRQPDMSNDDAYARAFPVLAGPEIASYGQPVACVVASTFEQARAAAWLVDVAYEPWEAHYDLATRLDHHTVPEMINGEFPAASAVGDFEGAFSRAPVQLDELYVTPYVFSQPMELHGCLAAWQGDAVTVHVPTQITASSRLRIAATFGLDPQKVRVLSRYVGGGFGSKLRVHADAILAVMAARAVGQPVKITLTRQQVFQLVEHRPLARQRVRLGAARDGRLLAFGHDVTEKSSADPTSDFLEPIASTGRALYAAADRRTSTLAVPLDLPSAGDVRAPGEAPGLLAIECAVDELAYALDIDPIELRIRNEPTEHPERHVPFSQRRLVECLRDGAQRFGWDRRPRKPRSVRDGRRLVGYGVAAAIRGHFQESTSVRVRLDAAGVTVLSDMTDIGTGTYTILTQVAAETLGVPLDRVRVELGDSDLPTSAGSGGSWGATNSCTALARACGAAREQVLAAVPEAERAQGLLELVARYHPDGVEATGSVPGMSDDPRFSSHYLSTYGAHFAEVHVDLDTAEIRLRRMLGVFDVGRVFNAKTARSQLVGGMIWGVGAALLEEGYLDPRSGAFVNRDLAGYLVPVHADIPDVDAIILDGYDDKANELGAKGLGEVGICGSGAAVANAVYNATGVRVRHFPITLEKLLPHLPVESA